MLGNDHWTEFEQASPLERTLQCDNVFVSPLVKRMKCDPFKMIAPLDVATGAPLQYVPGRFDGPFKGFTVLEHRPHAFTTADVYNIHELTGLFGGDMFDTEALGQWLLRERIKYGDRIQLCCGSDCGPQYAVPYYDRSEKATHLIVQREDTGIASAFVGHCIEK
jgi:hypothetical protein